MSLTREQIEEIRKGAKRAARFKNWLVDADDFNALCDMALRALPEREGWVSVSERLPDSAAPVLIAKKGMLPGRYVQDVAQFADGYFWYPGSDAKCRDTTHWRPLPPPPPLSNPPRTNMADLLTERDVLAELVRLKDLHDKIATAGFYQWGTQQAFEEAQAEYARCKPLAWAAAREVLSRAPAQDARREALEEAGRIALATLQARIKSHRDLRADLLQNKSERADLIERLEAMADTLETAQHEIDAAIRAARGQDARREATIATKVLLDVFEKLVGEKPGDYIERVYGCTVPYELIHKLDAAIRAAAGAGLK